MWRGGWNTQVTPQRDCLPTPGEMHEPHRAVTSTMSGEGKHFRFKQTQKQELKGHEEPAVSPRLLSWASGAFWAVRGFCEALGLGATLPAALGCRDARWVCLKGLTLPPHPLSSPAPGPEVLTSLLSGISPSCSKSISPTCSEKKQKFTKIVLIQSLQKTYHLSCVFPSRPFLCTYECDGRRLLLAQAGSSTFRAAPLLHPGTPWAERCCSAVGKWS